MSELKYTIIKTQEQYNSYCNILEELVRINHHDDDDEIDLLTLLIEKWDAEQFKHSEKDPIEIIKSLMDLNGLRSNDLAQILQLTKGTVSKILNYQKGLSKESIRKLSDHFSISQEALNRPYQLVHKYQESACRNATS